MNIGWENIPEGFDFFLVGKSGAAGKPYMKVDSVQRYVSASGSYVAFEDAGDFDVIARPDKPWSGEGLPPVGTVCESMWNESRDEWFKAKVFGVNEHGQPIFRWEEGVKKYEYQASPLSGHRGKPYFRPIRTPEQIAAEEREKGIEAILDAYTYTVGPCTHMLTRPQAARLYDAEVRKATP